MVKGIRTGDPCGLNKPKHILIIPAKLEPSSQTKINHTQLTTEQNLLKIPNPLIISNQ